MTARRGVMMVEGSPVDHKDNIQRRSGQAMAEFLVGLVSVMLLVVGLQQISLWSQKSFEAHTSVRRQLAEQMADPTSEYTGDFLFARPTDPGPDETKYSGDDRVMSGDDRFYTAGKGFLDAVWYETLEANLWSHDMANPYYRLSDSQFAVMSESFQMYYAEDAQPVVVVPFLRRMLGRDSLTVREKGWMPDWNNL